MLLLHSFNVNGLRTSGKINAILKETRSSILCLQETRWDEGNIETAQGIWKGKIIVNNGTEKSGGVAVLIKQNCIKSSKVVHKDKVGRLLITDIQTNNNTFRIINIHAPNEEKGRKEMFRGLRKWINEKTIIVGDMNVTLTRNDIAQNNTYKNDTSRTELYNLMEEKNLADVWRLQNPEKRQFSRRQVVMGVLKQSRIDLCLAAPETVKIIRGTSYSFNSWSDHAILECSLTYEGRAKGGGTWCLNAHLLTDKQYVKKIQNTIRYVKTEAEIEGNIIENWENIKGRFKKASINYSKNKNWREKLEEQNIRNKLEKELELLDKQPDRGCETYEYYKTKLNNIERKKCRGAAIRARFKELTEGERCTAFFLGLEKQRQNKAIIDELKDINDNNRIHREKDEILQQIKEYFTQLYKEGGSDREETDKILGNIDKTINKEDRVWCDSKIKVEEIKSAIDQLNNNRSPGADGLTAEFYKAFKDLLAPLLLDLYQGIQSQQETPRNFAKGIITLIYKNKGNKNEIRNYRPISLLNTDYKILTKILANRLKIISGEIISRNQTYSIPDRDIQDSIMTIRDTVRGMTAQGGLMLNLDMEKAFDRVEHSFMFKTLEKVGLGNGFIGWIKLLYANARSVIKCNGVVTESFRVERSLRQGCPLSALLFSIVAEPLAQSILKDNGIRGIETPRNESVRITQYADDITVTVKSDKCIDKIMTHLEAYGLASGAKINVSKTELGQFGGGTTENKWGFKINNGCRKVLGVYIGANEEEARDRGWREIIKKVKNIMNMWKGRGLTLKGKVTVVNALILSRINHVLGVCELPQWALNSLNAEISSFLWRGKGNSIAHRVLIANKREGGLGLIDISVKKEALRAKIVRNFLNPDRQYPWEDWMAGYLAEYGERGEYNLYTLHPGKARGIVPGFYQEVLEAWGKILPHLKPMCRCKEQVLQLPFLKSPFFRWEGRVLVSGHLEEAGLTRVGQVLNEGGEFDITRVCKELKNKRITFRKGYIKKLGEKLEQSFEPEWRILLKQSRRVSGVALPLPQLLLRGQEKELPEVNTKSWYRLLLEGIKRRPTAEKHWKIHYPNKEINTIWTNLDIPLIDSHTYSMDYNIRHRNIYTGIILHQINKKEHTRTCTICKEEPEDIEHIFQTCKAAQNFRTHVRSFLQKHCNLTPSTEMEWNWTWFFGITGARRQQNNTLINTILAIARKSLWIRRNYALFEKKTVNIKKLFQNTISIHLKTIYSVDKDTYEKVYGQHNTLDKIIKGVQPWG